MKLIKFAALLLTGSLALVATRVQAAAAAYPISLSFTTYNQVTSTDALGVITFSTSSTTWNNATILAKLQGMGITLPGNPRLAVIKGGDIVVLDSAGNIALNLDGYSSDTYEVYLYLDDISAEAQTIKSAKLSSTVQYIGTASLFADFVTYTNDVSVAVVKHGGFFTSNEDAFDFFSLGISGSFTRAAPYTANSGNIPSVQISGNMSVWGAGEYYHFDNVSGMDIYQPTDMTASIPSITGNQQDTILANFNYSL